MTSKKNSLNFNDFKETVIDSIIFFSPFIITNLEYIQNILEKYISDPNIIAISVAFILYISKKFVQGTTNVNKIEND